MTGSRQVQVADFIASLRRKAWMIFAVSAGMALFGYAGTFLFPKKYTSRSLVQVEAQVLPSGYVKPIVTERLGERITTLQQRVLTQARLVPMLAKLGLAEKDQAGEELLDKVRTNLSITPAEPGATPSPTAAKRKITDRDDIPGFYISFNWSNAAQAQQICAAITSMILDENLKARQQVGQSTTDFLARELDQAKQNLDQLDGQLAAFKKQHLGHLPGDVENNLKILSGLDSQLDANTQVLTRSQQEKSFAESLLAQELTVWKTTQQFSNLPSLREELNTLQNQLITLQSRYTDEHPDVLKLKCDIAEIKNRLHEIKESDKVQGSDDQNPRMEPETILALRERIHQQDGLIERTTAEQTRLKQQIDSYQSRLALSPEVEEEYKKLTRDTETAHTIYSNLLENKTSAEMQTEMEREQQGEQIKLLEAATLPIAPTFPVPWMFVVGGFALGLAITMGKVVLHEIGDQSIRNEQDVADLLNLPTLALMPWASNNSRSRRGSSWKTWLRPLPMK